MAVLTLCCCHGCVTSIAVVSHYPVFSFDVVVSCGLSSVVRVVVGACGMSTSVVEGANGITVGLFDGTVVASVYSCGRLGPVVSCRKESGVDVTFPGCTKACTKFETAMTG